MPATYTVEVTAVTGRDLQSIIDTIALNNPVAAARALDQIEGRMNLLRQMPVRGRVVPELAAYGIHTYRELVVTPWRIIYRISGPTVYVLAVLDGRRNVEDVLLDRLLK